MVYVNGKMIMERSRFVAHNAWGWKDQDSLLIISGAYGQVNIDCLWSGVVFSDIDLDSSHCMCMVISRKTCCNLHQVFLPAGTTWRFHTQVNNLSWKSCQIFHDKWFTSHLPKIFLKIWSFKKIKLFKVWGLQVFKVWGQKVFSWNYFSKFDVGIVLKVSVWMVFFKSEKKILKFDLNFLRPKSFQLKIFF